MNDSDAGWFRWQDECLILNCRVQPRATRDGFGEPMGGQLKIRITAPPVDGKANAHLIKFLADAFAVQQQSINIIRGESGRQKQVSIHNPGRLPELPGLTTLPKRG